MASKNGLPSTYRRAVCSTNGTGRFFGLRPSWRDLPQPGSTCGDRARDVRLPKVLLGEQTIVFRAKQSQVSWAVVPTFRPGHVVVNLQKRARATALPIRAHEGAAETIALQHIAAHFVRNVLALS